MTTRRRDRGELTGSADRSDGTPNQATEDADKISVAESVSDVTPPPNTHHHPQLNPFTHEWFAQLVNTAASAAATAVANSARAPPAPTSDPTVPRLLNDRKVPDFWEEKPEFWLTSSMLIWLTSIPVRNSALTLFYLC